VADLRDESMKKIVLSVLLGLPMLAAAEIKIQDDIGEVVRLAAPAKRIVSLAPHVTENLFAAGAGAMIAGVVEHSDYPEAAKHLPSVGPYSRLDLERVIALKPDLVIAWESGNAKGNVEKLRALGLTVYVTQPNDMNDIALQIETLGKLAGTEKVANAAAQQFRHRLAGLQKQYSDKPPVRVFYQVWKQPLMTVGGQQIISKGIRLCGGENVFGQMSALAPTVSVEAVLAAKPDVIVASGMEEARPEWLDDWQRWKTLPAVANGHLYFIPPDLIQRHTPRLLEGMERLCGFIDKARKRNQIGG
jgi:iron complex transport system substrate-binding protein